MNGTVDFTPQEIDLLTQVISRTWHTVSQDLPLGTYTREGVLEIVADRMDLFTTAANRPVIDRFLALSWDDMRSMAPMVLQAKEYE